MNRATRPPEKGFALLIIFIMAAAISIALYMEMPRVAFESQRVKEQLLVDRGNQYKRAIQVFFRKNKRFPATIDELEKFQEVRYLRHKYKDPFTGKDEWRLIHVDPTGVLTDSLVQKPQNPLGKDGSSQTGNGSQGGNGQPVQPGFGTQQASNNQPQPGQTGANGQQLGPDGKPVVMNVNGTDGTGGLNMALAHHPSDRSPGGSPGQIVSGLVDPNQQYPGQQYQGQQYQGQQLPYPGNPPNPGQSAYAGATLQPGVDPQTGQPVAIQPGQIIGVQPAPGQPYNPNQPNPIQLSNQIFNPNSGNPNPGNPNPGQAYDPSQAYNPNLPANQNYQNRYPGPGQINPGQFQPGQLQQSQFQPGQQPNAAISAIQSAIMSPRQPPAGVGSSFGNNVGSAGIAGVATTYKGGSIKVINDRQKYQEWEFIYDLKKDKSIMGAAAGQLQNMQNGQNGGNQSPGFGSFGGGGSTGPGSTPGQSQGGSSGFGGGGSFGQPSPPQQPPQQPQQE